MGGVSDRRGRRFLKLGGVGAAVVDLGCFDSQEADRTKPAVGARAREGVAVAGSAS